MLAMQNEQNRTDQPRPPAPASPLRCVLLVAGVSLVVCLAIVGGYVLLRLLPSNGFAHDGPDDPLGKDKADDFQPSKPILFAGWGQPDLVIVVSGQMHGYLFPCGCSEPQNGGLVRRLTFIDELKAKGWPVVGVDLGELTANNDIRRQRELKLQYTMKALDLMGYRAIGLGKNEMNMPLIDALSQYSIENARPRPLASTLDEIDKAKDKYFDLNVRPYEIFGVGANDAPPRVGVASLTGPDLEDSFKVQKLMKFRNNKNTVLPQIFKAFSDGKVDMAMLLHHEYPNDPDSKLPINANDPLKNIKMENGRRKMAEACAKAWEAERNINPAIPPLQLMMILTEESEPPGVMNKVKDTPTEIIEIGHKGKYVGVVGVFRKGGELTLKYELVLMEPAYAPKPGQKNAVLDVLEEYSLRVYKEDLLAKFIRSDHPIQVDPYVLKTYGGSQFVGSQRCAKCHKEEHKIWAKTGHAKAYKTLEDAKRPSLRQFDPECIVCHTVGFSNPEGFNDLPRADLQALLKNKAGPAAIEAARMQHNAKLAGVGCESCHGPASAHANINPNDKKLHLLMNPYRASDAERKAAAQMKSKNAAVSQASAKTAKNLFDRRMERIETFCTTKCHDLENDVHWKHVLPKWVGGGIVHNAKDNVGNQWLPAPPPVVPAVDNGKK
jgi:Cytochrome c554 and c-prime